MNFLQSSRVADYFGDVLTFDNPKASAVFHLEQLSQNFDFSSAGLPKFRLRPSVVIQLNDQMKIEANIVCTCFIDGEPVKDSIMRLISENFNYLEDKEPVQYVEFSCFQKVLNKVFRNIDFGNVYAEEIKKSTVLDFKTNDPQRLVSCIQQATYLLKHFKDIDYHDPKTFVDTLAKAINFSVGIFEPTIVLVCDDKCAGYSIKIGDDDDKLFFGLIPVYKDGGWLCYMPHSLIQFRSFLIYEPEYDLIPFDKVNNSQVFALDFNVNSGIFNFLNSFYSKKQLITYDHKFTETLRIFAFRPYVDSYLSKIEEPRHYPFDY